MSIQAILEVAIGLVFTWLALSIATMYAQEWVVAKLAWRSTMLEDAIRRILQNDDLSQQFYDHPLIRGLYQPGHKPSYIPSNKFALTLFDILMTAGTESSLIQRELYNVKQEISTLQKNKQAAAQAQLDLLINLARTSADSDLTTTMANDALKQLKDGIDKYAQDYPQLKPVIDKALSNVSINKGTIDNLLQNSMGSDGWSQSPSFEQVSKGILSLSVTNPDLKQALDSILNGIEETTKQGESALAKARTSVESWFNDSMDRLSGWYKRRAVVLAFVIGLIVAIVLNVDSLQLATQLWREPALRDALAAQAQSFVQQNQSTDLSQTPSSTQLAQLESQFNNLNIPIGWIGTPFRVNQAGQWVVNQNGKEQVIATCTTTPSADTDQFGIIAFGRCYPLVNTPPFNDLTGWLLKIIGLLISGVAGAQGAPFWFDILKKLINIRGSGSNPSESQSQAAG